MDSKLIEFVTEAIYSTKTNANVHRSEAREMARSAIKAVNAYKHTVGEYNANFPEVNAIVPDVRKYGREIGLPPEISEVYSAQNSLPHPSGPIECWGCGIGGLHPHTCTKT